MIIAHPLQNSKYNGVLVVRPGTLKSISASRDNFLYDIVRLQQRRRGPVQVLVPEGRTYCTVILFTTSR